MIETSFRDLLIKTGFLLGSPSVLINDNQLIYAISTQEKWRKRMFLEIISDLGLTFIIIRCVLCSYGTHFEGRNAYESERH